MLDLKDITVANLSTLLFYFPNFKPRKTLVRQEWPTGNPEAYVHLCVPGKRFSGNCVFTHPLMFWLNYIS